METIKIPKSKYDIVVEIICSICIIGVPLLLIFSWGKIPNDIPGHYNAAGQIDRITNKSSLITLYIVTLIMYIGMLLIERFPQIWNTGVKITDENKIRIFRLIKNLLKSIKLLTIITFTYLIINTASAKPLPIWFTAFSLIANFGVIIYYTYRIFKNK